MKRGWILLVLWLLAGNPGMAQTIWFDMFLFNEKIGSMKVVRTTAADSTEHYMLETTSKAKFLWIEREGITRYEVTYRMGRLQSSKHTETENGKLKRWTNVTWNGKAYEVNSYKGKRSFTEAPVFSIVTIYFKDIRNAKRIFYEAEADFNTLQQTDAETWEFKSSDGNRNVYHFKNGRVYRMEFHVPLATVKMIRRD